MTDLEISVGDSIVFGSASPPADVVVDDYYAAPRHFALYRHGDQFRLVDFGHGHGPYIDGKPVRKAWLKPGQHFDFGGFRYRVSDDGLLLLRSAIGPCDLVVFDLSARTGDTPRLTNMSFVQREKTLLAILGPSGAGKTSLFYALMGELQTSTEGSLYFRGLDLRTHGDQIRTMLGFVPQEDHLHRTLTVWKLLLYADRVRRPAAHPGDRERRIRRVCAQLRVDERMDYLVGNLSGGQRKRVSIALELLAEPDLLMLDEPTSGLDAGMDREVMTLLKDYARRGHAVIVITHTTEHLDRARQMLALASEGRPAYSGPPSRALASLRMDSFADLMNMLTENPDPTVDAYSNGPAMEEAAQEADRASVGQPGRDRDVRQRGPAWMFARQLPVLIARQVALLRARGSIKRKDSLRGRLLAIGVAAMPILVAVGGALIAVAVSKSDGLGSGPQGLGSTTGPGTLSLLIILCMLSGQALTYSDIVSEFHVIRREHRTGTVAAAVVVSKWLVFAVAAVIQAALITWIFVSFKPGPEHSLFLGPTLELFVDLAAMTVTAMSLGLLISVLANKIEQAVNWNTIVAIGQISLNGVAADLSEGGPVSAVASFLPTRWGLATAASSIDLWKIAPGAPRDRLWEHTLSQWATDLAWLGALTAVFFAATLLRLSHKLNRPD